MEEGGALRFLFLDFISLIIYLFARDCAFRLQGQCSNVLVNYVFITRVKQKERLVPRRITHVIKTFVIYSF